MTKTDEVYANAGLVTNGLLVFGCLLVSASAAAQPPELSKTQRATLQAVVQAVDAAANQPPTPEASWPAHVLRASDGSHYVAFSVEPTGEMKLPQSPVLLYVRLATAKPSGVTTTAERSAVRDWLTGRRVDPRLLPGRRGIAVGDMPQMGATGNLARRNPGDPGLNDLQAMSLERQRAREREAEQEKQRKADLESRTAAVREMMPFEDFDVAAQSAAGDGARLISRAFTAGPGTYDLFIGWADSTAANAPATIRVMRRSLTLPPATSSGLVVSSVIIADHVQGRATPYPPAEQAAHPYTIGATEITPARDTVFSSNEELSVAFQVINAQASDTGKPDVAVTFRIVRVEGDREVPVASLNPQSYTESSLPADFDLRLGHPLFVAVGAPLATVSRGDYRLKIAVNDRLAGVTRTTDASFSVTGSPRSLLSEAPSLGQPFRREDASEGPVLAAVVQGLTPSAPSPALRRALDLAAAGKFVELLADDPVPQREQAARNALTGLALYTVGDASALTQFQRAYALGAPGGPVQFMIGAVKATQDRDAEAIAAWQSATDESFPVVAPFLVEAYLRRGDAARAAKVVAAELTGRQAEGVWVRAIAATHLAAGRDQDALPLLESRLAQVPGDTDAQWLRLQALYGLLVRGDQPSSIPGDREKFKTAAQAYINAGGVNAPLASEWLKALSLF